MDWLGLLGSVSGLADTGVNMYLTNQTNKLNERLTRESWSREDNAVQRRVADLKAAGLSPTLAAGSAAASSGAATMSSPKLNTMAAVQAYKQIQAQNIANENARKQGALLDKQIDNYGLPDWYVALKETFGAQELSDYIKTFGHKLFTKLFGEDFVSSSSGSSEPEFDPSKVITPTWFISNAPGDTTFKRPSEYRKGFKFDPYYKDHMDKEGILEQVKTNSTNAAVRNAVGLDAFNDILHFKSDAVDKHLSFQQIKLLIINLAKVYDVSYDKMKDWWDSVDISEE